MDLCDEIGTYDLYIVSTQLTWGVGEGVVLLKITCRVWLNGIVWCKFQILSNFPTGVGFWTKSVEYDCVEKYV